MRRILLVFLSLLLIVSCSSENSDNKNEPEERNVFLYLVALQGSSYEGKEFGCNDKLVKIEKEVLVENTAIEAAVKKLISIDSEHDLLNFVQGAGLIVFQVTVADSVADVYLKGNINIQSLCDISRVKEQLTAIGKQFSNYNKVNFFINNDSLDEFLSEEKRSF